MTGAKSARTFARAELPVIGAGRGPAGALPEPHPVGGQNETRLGAVAREIGVMKGCGAKRFIPHAGERAERLLDSQLDLDHRRAVARDQQRGMASPVAPGGSQNSA
ncbi:MAG TPA: hypothetical protein VGG79_16410 [Roseiarcus sp.]